MSSLFPHPAPQVGQVIGTFTAGAGQYGQAIPYVFGCIYVPEFRLWQQPVASSHTVSVGKGSLFGGGNSQTLYSGSYVSGFCVGPIPTFGAQVAIRRILGDTGILADFSEQQTWLQVPETTDQMNARLNASRSFMNNATCYNGALSGQIADPHSAAAIGGNIPGYQGIVTISFNNISWSNGRPPGIKAEICQSATLTGTDQIIRQSCAVATIFTKLLTDCGIDESDVDVSALTTQQVRGIMIPQDSRRDAIDNLMRYFDLETCQSGGVIRFFPVNRPVLINIPFSDFSTTEKDAGGNDTEPFETKDLKETDLPYSVQLSAQNYDNDYNSLVQIYTNVIGNAQTSIQYDMGDFVATSTELIQVAQQQFFKIFAERYSHEGYLPQWYNNLEPGDVVTAVDDDNSINTIRLKTVDLGGSNGIVKITSVRHSIYTSTLTGAPTYGGITITTAGDTTWAMGNLPPLRDNEASSPGAYVWACGTSVGWISATLYQSKDGGATWLTSVNINSPAIIGTVNAASGSYAAALPSASPYVMDTTSQIAITLVDTAITLGSVTLAQALGNQNAFLIGNEIVIVMTITLISAGVYGLSNFIRGRRATESAIAGHAAGEQVVMLSGPGIQFVTGNYAEIANVYQWKMVPNGQVLADVTAQDYAITGANMLPFSPVNFLSSVDLGSGSPDVTWTVNRRSRLGQVLTPTTNIPLGETSEQYHWIIRNLSNVVVHADYTSTPIYTYTHTQRNTDLGSPTFDMTGYTITCAQVSSTMGDGHVATYTFTGAYS